jgi:alginate biosynthesis protein AlgX
MAALTLAAAATAFGTRASASYRFDCPQLVGGRHDDTYFNTVILQGEEGWFFRRGTDLRDFYRLGPNAMERLSRLNTALKRHGITLIFVPVPVRGIIAAAHLGPDVKQPIGFDVSQAVEEHRIFVDQVRQSGVEAVDLTHSLLANPDREELWYKRDAHWTPEGARDAARVIANTLERLDALKDVPRVAYRSRLGEIRINELRMPLALQRFCTEVLPLEQVRIFETASEASSASDLFGGDAATPIAVVGTSYTAMPEFNFDGFLSEASGLPVANYAVKGGGAFQALLSFVHGPALRERAPKVLIWENPIYNELDKDGDLYFRQIIPALHGPCDEAHRIASVKQGGSTARLEIPAGIEATGHDIYLSVRSRAVGARAAVLRLNYDGIDGETISLRRSPLMPDFDSFYWELPDDLSRTLRSVDAELQDGTELEEVALCRAPGSKS